MCSVSPSCGSNDNHIAPNEICAPIHDRMPAILEPKDYARWLGEEPTEPQHLMMMLKPYPAVAMEVYPVSSHVGSVKNTDTALFEPLESNSALV